jgi:pseudaminic acid cytidylyltransferase
VKVIAIIPARGGSKRIPKKNIRNFLGKPIIAYSIETSLNSGLFDEVMVSTDDPQIAEIAEKFGAIVPFLRSKESSDDFSTTADVISEVLKEYKNRNQTFDYACCIYPTAPFIKIETLKTAFDLLIQEKTNTVLSIQKFGFPIQRAFLKDENQKLNWRESENALKRSQDLEPAFHDCGQYYFFNVEEFLQSQKLISENAIGLEVSELEAQDIDNEVDWKLAELKYQLLHQ